MANHCCEVICTSCGAMWCARGCSTSCGPDTKFLEDWRKKRENRNPVLTNDTCRYCKAQGKVAIY